MKRILLVGLLALAACSTTPPDPRIAQLAQVHDQYVKQRVVTQRVLDSLTTKVPQRQQLPKVHLQEYAHNSNRALLISDSLLTLAKALPTGKLDATQDATLGKWLVLQQHLAEWDSRQRQQAQAVVSRLASDYKLLDGQRAPTTTN